MWMKSPAFQARGCAAGLVAAAAEKIPDAKACERRAAVVAEQPLARGRLEAVLVEIGAKDLRGLRPQRAKALLPALSEEAHLEGAEELEIAGADVEHLLHASSGVEHRDEKGVVAAAVALGAIDGLENGLDLVVLEVLDGAVAGPLEGNGENSLALLESVRTTEREVTEERVDGRQSHVAGRYAVAPLGLEVIEELDDDGRSEIV